MIVKSIVIVVSALNMGGAQRVSVTLANYWARRGITVRLVCTFSKNHDRYFIIDDNVEVISIADAPLFGRWKLANLIWKQIQLSFLLTRLKADYVISFLARVNFAVSLASLFGGHKLAICERTWPPFSSLPSWQFNVLRLLLLQRRSKIVVQTNKSRDWVLNNLRKVHVAVIPNPIEMPLPHSRSDSIRPQSIIPVRRNVIIAVGRLSPEKQFDLLIDSYYQSSAFGLGWCLVILGDGPERERLQKKCDELGLNGHVFLVGAVGNLEEWYRSANIFVLSSKVEGFPNVLLEALACGLACISVDCDTGPRDMIDDGVNGLLVDPKLGPQGLARAIDIVVGDEQYRQKLSVQASLILDTLSVDNVMLRWESQLDITSDQRFSINES